MSGRLQDKVAVITGAGSGIGRAAAKLFHAEGARIVVADVTGAEEEVAGELGECAIAFNVDVAESAQVESMIHAAVDAFGKLDVLCNNAGIDGQIGPIEDTSEENFDRVIAVNLRGVYLGMKHAIPVMKQAGRGSIVNTASAAGLVGMPMLAVYCASKGGVVQLTRAAAVECAPLGIRINAVCPGPIDTPLLTEIGTHHPEAVEGAVAITPMARKGSADELAATALFLASDDASFVTGVAMPADGGMTTW